MTTAIKKAFKYQISNNKSVSRLTESLKKNIFFIYFEQVVACCFIHDVTATVNWFIFTKNKKKRKKMRERETTLLSLHE